MAAPLALPKNASTGRRYSGINVLILRGAVVERGYAGHSWPIFERVRRPAPPTLLVAHDPRTRRRSAESIG